MKKIYLIPIVALLLVGLGVGGVALSKSNINPQIKFISGTEYQWGEKGQVIVRTVNAFGNPISANWCNVTIYYPDKTVFVNNQPMTQGGADGSWYYEFTTPFTQIGVYEEEVVCQITGYPYGTREIGAGSSFHVSQTLTAINETMSATVMIIS